MYYTSPQSLKRIADRHLSRYGISTLQRGGEVYITEETTNTVKAPDNSLCYKVKKYTMLGTINQDDNVMSLRHVKAIRDTEAKHKQFQDILKQHQASKQYKLDQASQEFRERFNWQFAGILSNMKRG